MTDATKHLLSSPRNAARLREAMKGLDSYFDELNETTKEGIPAKFQKLLDRLN